MLNDQEEDRFCEAFKERLKSEQMILSENCTKIFYTNTNGDVVHVDMFRWKLEIENGTEVKFLVRFDTPEKHKKDRFLKYSKKIGVGDLPANLVLPVQTVKMMNRLVKVPKKPTDVIKVRYPLSHKVSFPYKWKCWLPWNYPSKPIDDSPK